MIQIDAVNLAMLIKKKIHSEKLDGNQISIEATRGSTKNPYASFKVKVKGNSFIVAISNYRRS